MMIQIGMISAPYRIQIVMINIVSRRNMFCLFYSTWLTMLYYIVCIDICIYIDVDSKTESTMNSPA